jgi:hypothetical protein
MGEVFQILTSDKGPVKKKTNTRHATFVNQAGLKLRYPTNAYLELKFCREPKDKNKAEDEEVIYLSYPAGTVKVRGNRAALDLILLYHEEGALSQVEVTNGVDPEKVDDSKNPVIYSLTGFVPNKGGTK